MPPFILSQKSRYHGNNVEGYAPMFSACCLFLTLPLPARASNVCRHGDRLFHLVNMMWHVSSCTSQEMTGDWFILLPTQTMNDDTVKKKKLRSQYQKGQFQVLYLKRKMSSLSKTLSDALMWLIFTNNGQTMTLSLINLLLPNVSLTILVSLSAIVCDL